MVTYHPGDPHAPRLCREAKGRRVRALFDMVNQGGQRFTVGTVFVVSHYHKGRLYLTEAGECSGFRRGISGVHPARVVYLPE